MPLASQQDIKDAQKQAAKEPIFVNRLDVSIQVFGPDKRALLVQPLAAKGRHPNGVYEVHGEHFRQFTPPFGSLTEFREAAVDKQTADAVRARVAADAARAVVEKAGGPTVPPNVTATRQPDPPRIGTPAPVVLDTLTAFEIQRASPDATAQQRSDLAAYVINRRHGDKETRLGFSLAGYEDAMNRIADSVDPKDAPPEDFAAHPENRPPSPASLPADASTVTADGRLATPDGLTTVKQPDDAVKEADESATALKGRVPATLLTDAARAGSENSGDKNPITPQNANADASKPGNVKSPPPPPPGKKDDKKHK